MELCLITDSCGSQQETVWLDGGRPADANVRHDGNAGTLLDIFRRYLPHGNYFHFGFEQNEKNLCLQGVPGVLGGHQREDQQEQGPAWAYAASSRLEMGCFKSCKTIPDALYMASWLSAGEISKMAARIFDPQVNTPAKQAADKLVRLH